MDGGYPLVYTFLQELVLSAVYMQFGSSSFEDSTPQKRGGRASRRSLQKYLQAVERKRHILRPLILVSSSLTRRREEEGERVSREKNFFSSAPCSISQGSFFQQASRYSAG